MLHLDHPLQKHQCGVRGTKRNVNIQQLPGFLTLKLDIEQHGKKLKAIKLFLGEMKMKQPINYFATLQVFISAICCVFRKVK